MITGLVTQDTIKPILVIRINTEKLISDSVFRRLDEVPAHIREDSARMRRRMTVSSREPVITDTTSVCVRNTIADVTFSDSLSFIHQLSHFPPAGFPFQTADKGSLTGRDQSLVIIRDLKDGDILPQKTFHHDWIIAIILLAAYLWLILRSSTRSIFSDLTRFLLFRGITESSSRNTGTLFTWQSTIMNFVAFMVIGLFGYCVGEYYSFIPAGFSHFLFMLISLLLVILSITSRHLICVAAGNLSGQYEIFNEYLMTIYQSYRFSSVILFGIVIMLVYSSVFSSEVYFIMGAIVLIIFYLYRVSRLLIIFIKRNISILYLILYLCALEILPVFILIKYFTGLESYR
jgi:hypothetical protein